MLVKNPIIPPRSQPGKRRIFYWGLAKLALGLMALYGSVDLFVKFTHFETTGGTMRLNRYFILLYKIGGKWLVLGIGLAGGALFLYEGYRQVTKPGSFKRP